MPDSSHLLLDELPPLTDQDVSILYDIVSRAQQQSSDLPFKALFEARDLVLRDHGVSLEHDRLYLRFLLHVGDELTGAGTAGLVSRFRALLARLGIQLVLGEAEDASFGQEERLEDTLDDAQDGHYAGRETLEPRMRTRRGAGLATSRRASFNDSNLDTTWISGERPLAHSESVQTRPRQRDALGKVKHWHHSAPESDIEELRGFAGPKPDVRRPRSERAPKPPPGRRGRSTSSQGSVRIVREAHATDHMRSPPRSILNGYASESELDYLNDSPRLVVTALQPPFYSPETAYRPSDTQMMSDAEAFEFITVSKVARHCLHHWHDQAHHLRNTNQALWQIASNHDSRVLLRQSLEQMRDSLSDRRFWAQQERRAGRARDLFLLTKAFTHWAQSASDEVARMSVARRHIMRTRYFNAWRDISAVNELKCRRLGLQKWFPIWRAKAARRTYATEQAVAIYEEKLVEKTYWAWFWAFCARRAPIWKDTRVKRAYLARLRDLVARTRSMNEEAQRRCDVASKRRALIMLGERCRSLAAQDMVAVDARRRSLVLYAFNAIQTSVRDRPLQRRFEESVSQRVATKALAIWHTRSQLARQAVSVDQQRLLRDAWTSWNDQLRLQALTAKIDDRVVVQALYRWVLAERLALFERVMQSRLRAKVLHAFSVKLVELRFRLDQATLLCGVAQDRRTTQAVMLKLHAHMRAQEQRDRDASEFRGARDLHTGLAVWREKTAHLQRLGRWATDARFYCLTTHSLKCWNEATTNAKRTRRREAYATIRRRVKVETARQCLDTWRRKTGLIATMDLQAGERYSSRVQVIGMSIYDRWHEEASHRAEKSLQATNIDMRRLYAHALSQLLTKYREVSLQADSAQAQLAERADRLASKTLKKLGDSLFLLRRQQETATAWKARRFGQHRRNMLRYWAYQAADRRTLLEIKDPDSPIKAEVSLFSSLRLPSAVKLPRPDMQLPLTWTSRHDGKDAPEPLRAGPGPGKADFTTTQRAEEWTSFDFLTQPLPTLDEDGASHNDPQRLATATPLPGYLRTPSKRTARAKARFKTLASAPTLGATPRAGLAASSTTPAARSPFGHSIVASTTPAPLLAGAIQGMEALTPQVTPFGRKMRAAGFRGAGLGLSWPRGDGPVAASGVGLGGEGERGAPQFESSFGPTGAGTEKSVRFWDADVDVDADADAGEWDGHEGQDGAGLRPRHEKSS